MTALFKFFVLIILNLVSIMLAANIGNQAYKNRTLIFQKNLALNKNDINTDTADCSLNLARDIKAPAVAELKENNKGRNINDPFFRLKPAAAKSAAAFKDTEIKLKGILSDDSQTFVAVIQLNNENKMLYKKEGEHINELTIKKINEDSIEIQKRGGSEIINIK